MSGARVELEGLDRILSKLNAVRPEVKEAVKAVGLEVKGMLAKYPAQRHGQKMRIRSKRQLNYLRYAIRNEIIDVPYKRGVSAGSQTLGRRWTVGIEDDGLTAVVGNNVKYGPFVQDEKQQLAMHEGTGWTTVQDAEKEWKPEFAKRVRAAVRGALTHGRTRI